MDKFSNEQKRIALALLHGGPQTIEELNGSLGVPFDVLSKELKELVKLKLLIVDGYPLKYSLKKEIMEELKRRKSISMDDENPIRLKVVIDVQALVEEVAEKSLTEVEKALRAEKEFTVYDIFKAKPMSQGDTVTSYLEADLSVKDFKSLVRLMYFFGPTSVEVIKPKKLELSIDDLQEGLMDMAEMIQAYNYHVLKTMKKSELESFQKKLFK